MNKLNIRIVELIPMRVASALGFGASPEIQAWEKLLGWAKTRGLLEDISSRRFFGFNNPNPSPGSPNYGYEQWMTVDLDAQATGEVEIKDIPGGLYAVAYCESLNTIGEDWKRLVAWVEESSYQFGPEPYLEELLTQQVLISSLDAIDPNAMVFDLYLAISK